MRAGAGAVQQTLGAEAAIVIKQAVALAKRRGHAQVTPLHVAATLLSSRSSLLRRACLKSHPHPTPHPLQCRALELCFNVALNRLPTAAGPLLQSQPSLSNALVAALKRAQAHQRRGCLEHQQQQQPLLAIKVELEQLIISILDDPSVSRVMREAGFSSTSVKNNLEDSASIFASYASSEPKEVFPGSAHNLWQARWANSLSLHSVKQNPPFIINESPLINSPIHAPNWKHCAAEREQLRLVIDVLLLRRKRNIVLLGDSIASTEGLVSELKYKIEAGVVPQELRSVKFFTLDFSALSIRIMKREDVDSRLTDLRRVVQSFCTCGVIIYVGNMKWVVDEYLETDPVSRDYNPAEHLIMEIGRFLSDFAHYTKLWLLGIANTQTFMRCQTRQPSIESQWALQAVPIPSGGLSLTLHSASGMDFITGANYPQYLHRTQILKSSLIKDEDYDKLSLCKDCASNYEKEARVFLKEEQHQISNEIENGPSSFPYWMRHYRNQIRKDGSCEELSELKKKWNRLCQSLNHSLPNQIQRKSREVRHENLNSGEASAGSPRMVPNLAYTQGFSAPFPLCCSSSHVEKSKVTAGSTEVKTTLALGIGNGGSHSWVPNNSIKDDDFRNNKQAFLPCTWIAESSKRKTVSGKELCTELQENIPWQSKIMPSISDALSEQKNIWFLLTGSDWIGKRRLAITVAESFFGSAGILHLSTKTREVAAQNIIEYINAKPQALIFIEDIDHAEKSFLELLRKAMVDGKVEDPNGKDFFLTSSIIILTSGRATASTKEQSSSVIPMKLHVGVDGLQPPSEDVSKKRKSETVGLDMKKDGTKKHYASTLDLNVLAQEEEEEKEETMAIIHSHLTQESRLTNMENDDSVLNWFFSKITQRFALDLPADLSTISESFLRRLRRGFGEVLEDGAWSLLVEDDVLTRLVDASCSFLNCLMDAWVRDVLQRNMEILRKAGKDERIRMKLCLDSERLSEGECGYQGSPLPNRIEVVFDDCKG
ncbi:protein SMAX1-LIKE 4 [Nymphaea colorata]|nr:protein SMAX1-LIKE 4 [Nymphaea colorata]